MFRSHAVPPLRKRNSVFSRAKKGYFSTFSRRWGRENALCAAIAQRGGWRRPIYVPGAERGAAGASRGRAGAEKRKSSFLGRVGTTLSRMKLYSTWQSICLSKVRSKDGYNRMEEWWRTFVKECATSQSPPKKT